MASHAGKMRLHPSIRLTQTKTSVGSSNTKHQKYPKLKFQTKQDFPTREKLVGAPRLGEEMFPFSSSDHQVEGVVDLQHFPWLMGKGYPCISFSCIFSGEKHLSWVGLAAKVSGIIDKWHIWKLSNFLRSDFLRLDLLRRWLCDLTISGIVTLLPAVKRLRRELGVLIRKCI